MKKEIINRIVNDYLKWEQECEDNNISKDDDEAYTAWLEKESQKEFDTSH